jgi:signal transduction histidine kinase
MSGQATGVSDLDALLDALLFSVSHDLRSPLLAISLSAELIEQRGEGADEAMRALRTSATDLERMLAAVTALSRARRRQLDMRPAALGELLAGHVVISEVPELASVRAAVDAASVKELLATLAEQGPVEAQIGIDDGSVRCDFALRGAVDIEDASPLAALAGSLERHAGGTVEALAVHELTLSRQGATLAIEGDRLLVTLPLAS